jgi:hypothetical protein
MVKFGEVTGDQIAEVVGITRDFLGELSAVLIEHIFEGLQARRQHLLNCLAAAVERRDQRVRAFAEGVRHRIAATRNGVGDAGTGLFELGDDIASAQREIEHQRIAGRA